MSDGYSVNLDKVGVREWLTYRFYKPLGFAREFGLAERTVRHLMTLGLPFHGQPHKGTGGVRLSDSAKDWLDMYRRCTCDGRFRFWPSSMNEAFLDELHYRHLDEAHAFHRMYGGPEPDDPWMKERGSTQASERRSWKTKFKQVWPKLEKAKE